ncbi:MAG: M48 family metallopeptidase [Pirellula sp.]
MLDPNQQFRGGVFHHSIPDGRIGAEIRITPSEIIAEPSAEALSVMEPSEIARLTRWVIPLSECQVDLGGASGRMVFCRNKERDLTIFCEERGFAAMLGDRSGGRLSEQLHIVKKRQAGENHRFRFWLAVGAAATLLFGVIGYFSVLAAARLAIAAVPISMDEKIGSMAMQTIEKEKKLAADHPATKFVTEIVDRLKPHAAIPAMNFKVIVIESSEVNAFALPGGQMVVYTGLLKKAETGEQVAGVLAHEMSHATLRHGLQRVSQSLGIVAAIQFLVGDAGGLLALGSQAAQTSILTSYSRQSETEADLEGARMLHETGLDPESISAFFDKLKKEDGDIPGVLVWVSSHPLHEQRIESIAKFKATLGKKEYRPLELDLETVKKSLQ